MGQLKWEELEVYRLAEEMADVVWEIVATWTPFARDTVGRQIARAADGIGANIAGGFGRASPADNPRFVRTARGALYETRHFLRRAEKRGLIPKEAKRSLQPRLRNLYSKPNAYRASLRKPAQ